MCATVWGIQGLLHGVSVFVTDARTGGPAAADLRALVAAAGGAVARAAKGADYVVCGFGREGVPAALPERAVCVRETWLLQARAAAMRCVWLVEERRRSLVVDNV